MECFVASSFLCKRNSYLIKAYRSEKKVTKLADHGHSFRATPVQVYKGGCLTQLNWPDCNF